MLNRELAIRYTIAMDMKFYQLKYMNLERHLRSDIFLEMKLLINKHLNYYKMRRGCPDFHITRSKDTNEEKDAIPQERTMPMPITNHLLVNLSKNDMFLIPFNRVLYIYKTIASPEEDMQLCKDACKKPKLAQFPLIRALLLFQWMH